MSKEGLQSIAGSIQAVSSTLLGEFEHALDPKRRVTIPSGWRAAMGNPQYVFVMPDRSGECLNLLPEAEMNTMLAKLRQKALFDPALGEAAMAVGRVSEQVPLDVQGRIRISDKLLRFANLTTTVVMVGSVRMIKLWCPERLKSSESIDMASFRSALDRLDV